MPAQTQEKPNYSRITEEETEPAAAPAPAVKKSGSKFLRTAAVILLSVLCFSAGVFLRTRTQDPFRFPAEPGRLALPEYVLRDAETGAPATESTLDGFKDTYTLTYGEDQYETLRGIGIGDSWEAFAEAYGDVYIYEVLCDGKYYQPETPLTVHEFCDTMAVPGKMDPAVSAVEIIFQTGTDGKDLYYTDAQIQRARDQYDHAPGISQPVLGKTQEPCRFLLNFSFIPVNGGTLDLIYAGQYPVH